VAQTLGVLGAALPARTPQAIGRDRANHLHGIVNSVRLGLSNGTAESINSKVQAAIARARGFRTHRHLMTIIYLTCSKLSHLPAERVNLFWTLTEELTHF